MRAMFARVFSWATMSTTSGNSALLPVWSGSACVLTMVVTGRSVTW